MMFGQRLRVTDLALQTWTPVQISVLGVLASLEDHCRECASRFPSSMGGNIQLVAAMGIGIFIGSGAATFLTEQAVIALGLVPLLCVFTMLQLPRRQHADRQREQTLLAQEVQSYDEKSRQQYLGVVAFAADEAAMTPLVEDALRHLDDRSYLGQHQLAQLHLIQHKQWQRNDLPCKHTHLSFGHALHALLVEVIDQLRPSGQLPTGAAVPAREWYPYIILHASYVQSDLTREIMARLYISEGTYNRIRRRAVHSVAKAIVELERQMERQSGCP